MTRKQESLILSLLSMDPNGYEPVEIQKLMFLFTRAEENVPSYDFKYTVTDEEGNEADWKILDWELGALFYGIKEGTGDPERAKDDVMKKYGDEFLSDKKDLYLYMGTINGSQKRKFPNP